MGGVAVECRVMIGSLGMGQGRYWESGNGVREKENSDQKVRA